MDDHIDIAWALKIDHAQLGARLEAYVETKSAVTTFQACLLRLRLPSNSSIPPEIAQMIVDALRDASYEPKIPKWHKALVCVQDDCEILDHFKQDESVGSDIDYPTEIDDRLWEELCDKHHMTVKDYLQKFENPKSGKLTGEFAVCQDIFAKDFGITPYFKVHATYDEHPTHPDFVSAEISGYLTQTILRAHINSEPTPNRFSYHISQDLYQPVADQNMTTNTKLKFMAAIKALRLHVAHTHILICDINKYSGESPQWLSATGTRDENEKESAWLVSLSEEQQNNAKERSKVEAMLRDCGLPKRDSWGLPIEYRPYCNDCDTHIRHCEGPCKAPEPVLMMLGRRELELDADE